MLCSSMKHMIFGNMNDTLFVIKGTMNLFFAKLFKKIIQPNYLLTTFSNGYIFMNVDERATLF